MALLKCYTPSFVILLLLVFLLSCLTSFVGFAFGFTGTGGEDLGSLGMNMASYSMMAALPVSLIVGAFSRRALVWVYCALYAIASAGIYILDTANSTSSSEPLRLATPSPLWSATRAFGALGSVSVLYLVLAVLATLMFRVERRNSKSLSELTSVSL